MRWDRKWRPAAYRLHAEDGGSTGKPVAEGASTGKGLLGGGVPGRDGEPQDVAERPGMPLRRGTRSGQQARDEHGLGRDHPAQRGQPTLVLGLGPALEDESVEVLAGEAHLDPHPGCAVSTSDSGTEYSNARSRWGRPVSTYTDATGSMAAAASGDGRRGARGSRERISSSCSAASVSPTPRTYRGPPTARTRLSPWPP